MMVESPDPQQDAERPAKKARLSMYPGPSKSWKSRAELITTISELLNLHGTNGLRALGQNIKYALILALSKSQNAS